MNFLIIEDDLFLCEKLKSYFFKKWWANIVQIINNYEDAINEMSSINIYDVIILDLNLNCIWNNSIWLNILKLIRSKNFFIPVIIISWYSDISIMDTWFLDWANDYMIKPFRAEELKIRVNRWFKRYLYTFYYNKNDIDISYKWLIYNQNTNDFLFDWKSIQLSKSNKYLLLIFLLHREKFISRDYLFWKIYWNIQEEKNIRICILRLKNNLESIGINNWIKTIRWEWYIFKKE